MSMCKQQMQDVCGETGYYNEIRTFFTNVIYILHDSGLTECVLMKLNIPFEPDRFFSCFSSYLLWVKK